jgi:hypothetical protein
MAKVDLNMQVPTQNDNSEHSPFGEGAKLNFSKQRMFILQHRIKTKEHDNKHLPQAATAYSHCCEAAVVKPQQQEQTAPELDTTETNASETNFE